MQRRGKRTCSSKVVGCEIIWALVKKVIDKPAVSKWAVGDVGDAELFRRINKTISLVQCLEGRVFSLDSIDLCNYYL